MRVAIFLDGESPSEKLTDSCSADLVICADGAWNYMKNRTTSTDIVVGDFDSFTQKMDFEGEILQYPTQKDQTDSELALSEALVRGATEIDFYGAMGRRDDHAIANLGLLFKAKSLGCEARILTDFNTVYPVQAPCTFCGTARKGQIISIVPFGEDVHILETEGLKYPITEQSLSFSATLGISNEATQESYLIRFERGRAFVIVVH